jgi:type IV pilus assembly protein PilC
MTIYSYRAIDLNGKMLTGRMPAGNERELEARLKNGGMELINAKEQTSKKPIVGKSIPRKELINFCFHMEQNLRGGVLLTEALGDLIDGTDHQVMRDTLSVMLQAVGDGTSLSNALSNYPNLFDDVFIGLIHAGEEAGTLPDAFRKLGEGLRWSDELSSQLTKMMLYPAFTVVVLVGVAFFMLLFLLPQLAGFIKSAVGDIPFQTRLLLSISDAVVGHWGKMLCAPFILALIIWILIRYSSQATQTNLDRLKFKIPAIGSVIEKVALARFTSLFGMLYASGVPILRSLEVCQGAAGNRYLAQGLALVQQRITDGMGLSSAFESVKIFPNLVLRMIKIGESTGEIDKSLLNASYFFNRDIQERISKIQAVIEPLLTVTLGLMLGWLMIAVLGPIYEILGKMKI